MRDHHDLWSAGRGTRHGWSTTGGRITLAMQVLFATEHDGLLTLDFILCRDLAMPGGEIALAGQPFALTFAFDPDGPTVAVRRRLREWCEGSVLVVARPRDDSERHGLVMCHEDEVVELAFH